MDFDFFKGMGDGTKHALNHIPFLAGVVKEIPTPIYVKLAEPLLIAIVVGFFMKIDVIPQLKETDAVQNQAISRNAKDIEKLQNDTYNHTQDHVHRSEWVEKNTDLEKRINRLERSQYDGKDN